MQISDQNIKLSQSHGLSSFSPQGGASQPVFFPPKQRRKDINNTLTVEQDRDTHTHTDVPVVDGGVGEEGHVGGELAPEPESRQRRRQVSHRQLTPSSGRDRQVGNQPSEPEPVQNTGKRVKWIVGTEKSLIITS